jgi:hypothetical protein
LVFGKAITWNVPSLLVLEPPLMLYHGLYRDPNIIVDQTIPKRIYNIY